MTTLQLTPPSRVAGSPSQGRLVRVPVAPADLPSGVDVGTIPGPALGVQDPEHVGKAPAYSSKSPTPELTHTPPWAGWSGIGGWEWSMPPPSSSDVAAPNLPEHHVDLAGVGGPDCKSDRGGGVGGAVVLLRPQVPAEREVVGGLNGLPGGRQSDLPVPIGRSGVRHLEVDRPDVGPLGPVGPDSPAHGLAGQGVVELQRGGKARAPVVGNCGSHRVLDPAVPAAGEPAVAEYRPLEAGEVLEMN